MGDSLSYLDNLLLLQIELAVSPKDGCYNFTDYVFGQIT